MKFMKLNAVEIALYIAYLTLGFAGGAIYENKRITRILNKIKADAAKQ